MVTGAPEVAAPSLLPTKVSLSRLRSPAIRPGPAAASTTTTIIIVGSCHKGLYRTSREPINKMVLVVEGKVPPAAHSHTAQDIFLTESRALRVQNVKMVRVRYAHEAGLLMATCKRFVTRPSARWCPGAADKVVWADRVVVVTCRGILCTLKQR